VNRTALVHMMWDTTGGQVVTGETSDGRLYGDLRRSSVPADIPTTMRKSIRDAKEHTRVTVQISSVRVPVAVAAIRNMTGVNRLSAEAMVKPQFM